MGLGTHISRSVLAAGLLLAWSCADDGGPVRVDLEWNLTCPADSAVGCGSLAQETCLGEVGQRAILGARGESGCTGEPIIASCEAIQRADGRTVVFLEAKLDDADEDADFGLELRGLTIDEGGAAVGTTCNVIIVEDGLAYDLGACGGDPPSMEQPCQLSNVTAESGIVAFDLECDSLMSSITTLGFDVGAVGGGPTSMTFSNCSGF